MEIRLDARNTKALLKKLEKGIADARPFFSSLEPTITQAKDKQFASKGAYLGERWAPRKKEEPWPILQKTGRMKNSFKTKSKSAQQRVYGSGNTYYPYHQLGTRKMTARKILAISPALQDIITKEFKNYIDKLMK